jgi:N-acetylglucosaminyldiphosphoundecaprenol N-acetyl-beta-D-mannosaminyltransferase
MKVSHTSYEHVCIATVNEVMQAYDSPEFLAVMNDADLVTPDGMPLVWGLKLLGKRNSSRVYGPDLTPIVLAKAEACGVKVGFYGGAPEALQSLLKYVAARFPKLQVAYSYSPPFRPLTPEEDNAVTVAINNSGASILFVGLNSPQQNFWMAAHRPELRAVMLGVGAAFDFLSGSKKQAPRWMMRIGLEWLFRLISEPKRLWKRYLKHNPRFVFFFGLQLLAHAQHRLLGRPA